MKERIYTIPLTDALESGCDCVLCAIEKKAELDAVDFYTGPAMMEPDTRIHTNHTGFCPRHYGMMLSRGEKLAVALTLQTRLDEVLSMTQSASPLKTKRFSAASRLAGVTAVLNEAFDGCAVCKKMENQLNCCVDNFVFLLKKEPDFRKMFFESQGLCMKHFIAVLPFLEDGSLFEEMLAFQCGRLAALKEEIDRFVLKFDYRNSDMPWENAQDSPERAVKRLRGRI